MEQVWVKPRPGMSVRVWDRILKRFKVVREPSKVQWSAHVDRLVRDGDLQIVSEPARQAIAPESAPEVSE